MLYFFSCIHLKCVSCLILLCLENVLSQVSLYECSHHSFFSTWHNIFVGIVVWFYFIRILVVGFSFLADSVLLMLWISVSAYEHLCYVSFSFLRFLDFLFHNLYYWFSVGEATLPLHHLISHFTLTRLVFYPLATAK
jgi:hypothetical protein